MHAPKDPASTSVRVSRELREQIRQLEADLSLSTAATLERAIHSLRDELKWKKIGEYYDAHPGIDPEDEAWVNNSAATVAKTLANEEE